MDNVQVFDEEISGLCWHLVNQRITAQKILPCCLVVGFTWERGVMAGNDELDIFNFEVSENYSSEDIK